MSKIIKLPGRVESAEVGGIVTGANAIMDDGKGKVQSVINNEVDEELLRLQNEKQDNITVDNEPTEGSDNPVSSGGVFNAEKALSDAIEAILLLIPSAATALNQLADKEFVASSIATSTATFKGTFNLVSDLHLSADATHEQIAGALDSLSLDADTNDYCFVQVPESDTSEDIKVTQRYKFNGTAWAYEYDLNNSGFTAEQWAAINSNITAALTAKLMGLPTSEVLAGLLGGKQDALTFDEEPTAGSNNPVTSGGVFQANNDIIALINALEQAKQNVLTFDQSPVQGSSNPVTSGGVYDAIYLLQTVLATLGGNVETLQYSVSLLTEQVGILNTLYQALTQSDIIVGALPGTGVANRVYRVPGTSTYSDWMWYDNAWVKLAEYTTLDGYVYKGVAVPMGGPSGSAVKMFYIAIEPGTYLNFGNLVVERGINILKYDGANWSKDTIIGIDAVPTKNSQNLVTSGAVFDYVTKNGGAYDISANNPVGGQPAVYETLSDALGPNGENVPADVRIGGMSVKFIQGTAQSSDNKYVQYRLMADSFSTTESDWQGVDDKPTPESHNFVESDGVYNFAIPMTNAACIIEAAVNQNADVIKQVIVFRNWKNTGNNKYRSGVAVQYKDGDSDNWILDYNEYDSKETADASIKNGYRCLTSLQNISKPFTLELIIDFGKVEDETMALATGFNIVTKYGVKSIAPAIDLFGKVDSHAPFDNGMANRFVKEVYFFLRNININKINNVYLLIFCAYPVNNKYRSGLILQDKGTLTTHNMYIDFDTENDALAFVNSDVCYTNYGLFVLSEKEELYNLKVVRFSLNTTEYINKLETSPIINNYIKTIDYISRIPAYNFVENRVPNMAIDSQGVVGYYSGISLYIIKVNSEQYTKLSVNTNKTVVYIAWYSALPSFVNFIKRENYLVNEALIPIGAKYACVQINDTINDNDYVFIEQGGQFVERKDYPLQKSGIANSFDYTAFSEDGVVGTNGRTEGGSSEYWAHTNKISVHYGQKIKSWSRSISLTKPWAVFFDKDDNVCGYIIFTSSNVSYNAFFEGYVPQNAVSVIINSAKPILETNYIAVIDIEKDKAFSDKYIAFAGDSITYGYDDGTGVQLKNSWVEQVATSLRFKKYKNYGVSSATVMPVEGTPFAVSTQYTIFDNSIDILGVMIGINDAFRAISLHNPDYVLGTMSDRTTDTFYGALHVMWSGLLAKYPLKNGKKLFMIAYFGYSGLPQADWDLWDNAQREVAEYYSIPICDLKKNLGINQRTDINHEYWRNGSAHPTQLGANVIGEYISNWVKKNFEV